MPLACAYTGIALRPKGLHGGVLQVVSTLGGGWASTIVVAVGGTVAASRLSSRSPRAAAPACMFLFCRLERLQDFADWRCWGFMSGSRAHVFRDAVRA